MTRFLRVYVVSAAMLGAGFVQAQTTSISSIEINQGIGKQFNNGSNFVAGKKTVVRALLASAVTVDPAQTTALVRLNGNNIVTLAPKNYGAPTNVVDFPCPSLNACGGWAAGSYYFQVTVNGVSLDTTGVTYLFQTRSTLHILVKPVKTTFSGAVVSVPDDRWKSMWTFLRSVFPVADNAINWDVQGELDATAFDANTDAGSQGIWQSLVNLQPQQCSVTPKAAGCYDLIVGFIGRNPTDSQGNTLAGFTYGKPTNIVVETDPDAAATVPHEISHLYGAGDTYQGGMLHCSVNPAPDTVTGLNWDDPTKTAHCTAGRQAYPQISGTLIPAASTDPYEVDGRGALPDELDYMGAGGGQLNQIWITPDVYAVLFKALAPPPATGQVRQAAALVRPYLISPTRVVDFSGVVNAAGTVNLNPWETWQTEDAVPANTGAYSVRAVDSGGNVLASQSFDVSFLALTNPPKHITWAPFEGTVAFPANTVKFQILNGATLLKEVPVSAHDPVVAGVSPTQTGTTLNGPSTLSWVGTDADGDALTYNVEYTPDVTNADAEWQTLATNLTSSSFTQDFSQLPGGLHAEIQVTASDGVRSGAATSAQFIVPFKQPEVFIDPLEGGSDYLTTDEIELNGEAFDMQDGWIPDSGLVWTSNISGALGKGGDLIVSNLPAGQHTITLTATNSAGSGGLSGSKSIAVLVGLSRHDRRRP